MPPSSPPKRQRQNEADDPFNFQRMVDSLLLDGQITEAAIDQIADNFRSRLELNIPSPEYRNMAESFLNMRIHEKGKAASPTIPTMSPPKRESAFCNNESSLEQVPTTETCSSSGTEPFPDQHDHETHSTSVPSSFEEPVSSTRQGRSPIRGVQQQGQEASNRGRSPARSSNTNPPRSHRSRTPVDRWTRRGNASDKQTPPTNNRRRRSRSRSFRGLFGRSLGLNYETLPGDDLVGEEQPSVYHDAHMTMDSVNDRTPTPKFQRRSQRSDVKSPPTTGRRPPLDPNALIGGDVSTVPTSNATFPSPTPNPATVQRSPGAPTIGVETETSNFAALDLTDLKFNIGTTPKSAKSPSNRRRRSRQRSSTNMESPNMASPQAEMPNQTAKTPEFPEDDKAYMFSPWSDATTPNTPWTQDSQRGRRRSRSNPRTRSNQKTKTPASGKEGNGKSSQSRSQSPYGRYYLFGISTKAQTENNTETQPTQPPASTQTQAAFQSPIPPFQAPDAVFAEMTPPNDTTENVIGDQPREPMSSIPQPSFGVAGTAPKTPYEFQNNSFDAPFTDETAVNKKGRNTKTPVFEANLSIGKSKGKFNKKRVTAGRQKGAANVNSTTSDFLGTTPNDQGLKGAAPRVAETATQSNWIPNAFQYTTASAAKSPSNGSSSSAMDTDSDTSRTKEAPRLSTVDALHANIQFNVGVGGKSFKTNKGRTKRMDSKPSRPQPARPSKIDAPISDIQFSIGVGGKKSPKAVKGRSKRMDSNEAQPQPQPTCKTTALYPDIQFNIGIGGKSPIAGKGRPKRNGKVQPRSHSVSLPPQNLPANFSDSDLAQAHSGDSMNSTGGLVGQRDQYGRARSATEATMGPNQFIVQKARVSKLLEDARMHYRSKDYKSSIITNTEAIKVHRTIYQGEAGVDLLALLYSNRAAGLIMIGGAEAAVEDCSTALRLVPDRSTFATSSSEAGPALPSKLYSRMARSYLKLGKAELAEDAFQKAIVAANDMSMYCKTRQDATQFEETKISLHQALTDATFGIGDVGRFREAMEKLSSCSRNSIRPSDRLKCKEILGHVETALGLASGCDALHVQKVSNLGFLKNWRQVISHCERLAATNTKHEVCYVEDLAPRNPFAGIPAATDLTSAFFEGKVESDIEFAATSLSSKASGEAALRIPHSMVRHYFRALRLEEKYGCAQAALDNLKRFCRKKFDWLDIEEDKLLRTQKERQRADQIFKEKDYHKAADKYLSCLKIDSEECEFEIDGSSAGGRLHAVLHCNRAACFIELKRHHEALTECTAALRIHPRYMKAFSRRARCYKFLHRLEESMGEYKNMLRLVEEAKKDPNSLASFPCLFDGPHQMNEDDIRKIRSEYAEVCQLKVKADRTAQAEAAYRKDREKFRNESSNSNHDAHKRRENFFKSSSRRWDSFTDRKPKKSSKACDSKRDAGNNKSMPNANNGHPAEGDCHYAILQLKPNATDQEIKKAYRKMALMYHPDKNKDPKATDSFRLVTEAYDTLTDSKKRKQYDWERRWKRRF